MQQLSVSLLMAADVRASPSWLNETGARLDHVRTVEGQASHASSVTAHEGRSVWKQLSPARIAAGLIAL